MPEKDLPEPVDWQNVEDVLFRLTVNDISKFAEEHPEVEFYGFAFDCNADYGQAMPCLNTPDFFQLAVERKHLSPEILAGYEKVFGKPKPLDADELVERAKSMRWALE
ncbi:hypothetical protein VSU19_07750 [Verrucomicrobiales bacterium BCK34]|nr:hypothetical protein [Verrucomicrobiales bacterium BCK34]